MIILGVDPGTIKFGYGLVKLNCNKFEVLNSGTIFAPSKVPIHNRLAKILSSFEAIILEYQPAVIALEKTFYQKNVRTTIALGEARGIVLAMAGKYNLELKEFAPTTIKQSIGGSGKADKDRVQKMVRMLLNYQGDFIDDNESDALAIALCCHYRSRSLEKLARM